MHELGQFLRHLMDQEQMLQADLARRSGLSRQVIHTLLNGEMKHLPQRTTFDGLHRAFPGVPYSTLVLRAAEAAGMPVEDEPEVDYEDLSNEALLGILARRLEGVSSDGRQPPDEKTAEQDDVLPNVSPDDVTLTARTERSRSKELRAQFDEMEGA